MRAGLLSQPEVINRLNANFVCTTVLINDIRKQGEKGDAFAKTLADNWTYPLQIIFLTADGKVVSKMNSFKDFAGVHPDVAAPPGKTRIEAENDRGHVEAFLKHLAEHFP